MSYLNPFSATSGYLSPFGGYTVEANSSALTGQNCRSTATSSNGDIVQNHLLIGSNCTANATSSNGDWQTTVLVGQNCIASASSSSGDIVQTHLLTGSNCIGFSYSSNGVFVDSSIQVHGGFFDKKKPQKPIKREVKDTKKEIGSIISSAIEQSEEKEKPVKIAKEIIEKIVEVEKIVIQRDTENEKQLQQQINHLNSIIISQQKKIDDLIDENQTLLLFL